MKRFVFVLLLSLAGCSAKSGLSTGGQQSSKVEEVYEQAEKLFKKKYYDQAIENFDRLRSTFPFSTFAVKAELRVADALFAKREYAESADAYRSFAKLHPKHAKTEYSLFRVGLALYKDAPKAVDRDQTSTELALGELRTFLTRFPESEYGEEATELAGKAREKLAAKELYIGVFYFKTRDYSASLPRLTTAFDRYPETSAAQTALFLSGKAHFGLKKWADAKTSLGDYLERYPESEDAAEAKELLKKAESRGGGSGSSAEQKSEKGVE